MRLWVITLHFLPEGEEGNRAARTFKVKEEDETTYPSALSYLGYPGQEAIKNEPVRVSPPAQQGGKGRWVRVHTSDGLSVAYDPSNVEYVECKLSGSSS